MTNKLFQSVAALSVMLGLVAAQDVVAKDSPQVADIEQALTGVATPELPVNAANLVSQSKDSEKESVTMLVVQTVSEINPASLPAVIGAIGRPTPAMASVAAASAASLQPRQVVLITRSAVGAAPDRAGEIVSAILEKLPAQYALVAVAAADVAPSAGKDILNAVMNAVPSLKPYIEKASSIATVAPGNVPVLTILNQAAILARRDQSDAMSVAFATPGTVVVPTATTAATTTSTSSSGTPTPVLTRGVTLASGPIIGPPPVPLLGTPVEIDTNSTGPQQPGGRNYSAP